MEKKREDDITVERQKNGKRRKTEKGKGEMAKHEIMKKRT